MADKRSVSPVFRAALLALASFFAYLFFYALVLLIEARSGGGEAYLWFLMLGPAAFVLYQLFIGALSVLLSGRLGLSVCFQEAALFLSLLLFWIVDCVGGRVLLSEARFSDFTLDLAALLIGPFLIFCSGRAARFVLRRRAHKGSHFCR